MSDLFTQTDASFSPCGKYRYLLSRAWDPTLRKPWLGWIMLNPSTADAEMDDPTIRRCTGFAASRGFGGICVANLFMYRATVPSELAQVHDPEGPSADKMIRSVFEVCPAVVAAWGVHGTLNDRGRKVLEFIRREGWMSKLVCLGLTIDGHPKHPLYIPACRPLIPFEEARADK